MGFVAWLVAAVLQVVPLWRILPRAGIASPWALAAAVPLGTIVLLWVMAYKDWPAQAVPDRVR